MKFFVCEHCGNLAELIIDIGVPMSCCGDEMTELVPNTVEASVEKHLPVVSKADGGITVQIGSVPHPMTDEHHIGFVCFENRDEGVYIRKNLNAGDEPKLSFSCAPAAGAATVYAYCNLHGLWKTEVE